MMNRPTSYSEQMLRARQLAHDIAQNVVSVLTEKDEHPGVVFPALTMVMCHIQLIAMTTTDSQGDFRAELKEVPGRIERGEEPKL